MQDNPDCILVVTPCGGHLGWVSGPGAPLGQLLPFPLFPVVVSCTDVPFARLCIPCRTHANCTSVCLLLRYCQAMMFYSALAQAYLSYTRCTWLCYSLAACESVSNHTRCTCLWLIISYISYVAVSWQTLHILQAGLLQSIGCLLVHLRVCTFTMPITKCAEP